jgi:hypothetical protein
MNSVTTSQDGNIIEATQTGDSNEAITRQKSGNENGQNNARWK